MSEEQVHAARLAKMAAFLRDLVPLARKFNGLQERWEDERWAEIHALDAGVEALKLLSPAVEVAAYNPEK